MDNSIKKETKNMAVSKWVLAASAAVLYVMQVCILVPVLGIMYHLNTPDFNFTLIGILLGIALILGIAALVFAVIGTVKREDDPKTKTTVIIKAVMIPFFCINIYLWCVLLSGLMNPFLFLTIPIVICLGVCLTWCYMFMTSFPDIIYMIAFLIRKKKKPDIRMILGLIFEFFFLLDLVGAILIHKSFEELDQ